MSSAKNFSLRDSQESLVSANLREGETAGVLAKLLLLEEMARRESEKKEKKPAEPEPTTGAKPE